MPAKFVHPLLGGEIETVYFLCAGDDAGLLSVSAEELKSLMETMAKEKLTSYQVINHVYVPLCCSGLSVELLIAPPHNFCSSQAIKLLLHLCTSAQGYFILFLLI